MKRAAGVSLVLVAAMWLAAMAGERGVALFAQEIEGAAGTAVSVEAKRDVALTTNPEDEFWRAAEPILAERNTWGKPVPGYRTRIYSRWTERYLYFLFVCPYQKLHLKENPTTTEETNELWKWDVAEVFIGWNFQDINRYKEFEISPQGEWIDLDIDHLHPLPEGGWRWNSGFQVAARIDSAKKVWYGAMRIPLAAIDVRPPAAGTRFRVNFYRSQGPPGDLKKVAWRATMSDSFHVPSKFGILQLVANAPNSKETHK